MLLKGLKVCNLYGHFSLFSWDLHGVTACLYCTWMSAGDFVAWGITFLNLSFSHARTKACRNVYQLRKHRVYFIAQWAATQWYQTMYNGTFQMVYFLLDTSVWTCLKNMYSRCGNFVCGCHIVFAKNVGIQYVSIYKSSRQLFFACFLH